jgi:ADP-dependent NAD(P)H-hydrate dehydratase / NAD(P)H-hydrate epimerase
VKVLIAAQMREADRLSTERYGIPSLQLMENAGTRVVEVLRAQFPDLARRKIIVLCGKGNNGGDGLVVARLLRQLGAQPSVYLFAAPDAVEGDAAVNLKRWQKAGRKLKTVTSAREWEAGKAQLGAGEILVDALLGTGLRGPVEGLLRQVIEDVNRLRGKAFVAAVDIPSGLPSDGAAVSGPAIFADSTVTFTAPKLGQLVPANAEHVGRLLVRSIGTPAELLENDPALKLHWLEPGEFRSLPLRRRANTHKGTYGHALIVAGSRGKTGAAVLAGWGALRSGAGLVTVATPANVLPIVASHHAELMTEPLEGTESDTISLRCLDYGRFDALAREKSVMAIGPGLSTHPETQQFVHKVVAETSLPAILDADGLNAFGGQAKLLCERKSRALAVTPHPGEMARLLGCTTDQIQAQRLEVALRTASEWNAHVVLKGFRTVVAAPDGRAFINSTGNPGMATGGTGDVLTGMLAGLTAQFGTEQWAEVLALGVYLHGLAGDLAAAEVGEMPLVASDLVGAIPRALAQLLRELDGG